MRNKIMVVLMVIMSLVSYSEVIRGKVIHVQDGDTIDVLSKHGKYRINLYAVDAPELEQSFGKSAQAYTKKRLLKKDVEIEIIRENKQGIKIAKVFYEGNLYNQEIIRKGYAWWKEQYVALETDLILAELKAKEKRTGLWKLKGQIEPWKWRKENKSRFAKK